MPYNLKPGTKEIDSIGNFSQKATNMLKQFSKNFLGGGAYGIAKNLLGKNQPQETFLPTKKITNMPKKRANGGHQGYVVNINTGKRIPTETIPRQTFTQAQNILKKNK